MSTAQGNTCAGFLDSPLLAPPKGVGGRLAMVVSGKVIGDSVDAALGSSIINSFVADR